MVYRMGISKRLAFHFPGMTHKILMVCRDGNLPAFARIQAFDGPQGHSQDLSKFSEKCCMCMYTL